MNPNASIVIRGRSADDWRALAVICRALPQRENPLEVPYPGDDLAREVFKTPDNRTKFSLVAEVEGRVAGEIALHRRNGRLAHSSHIERFMVDPLIQGRGVGSILIDAMIDLAENSLNLTRIDHLIAVDNEAAINLHRKHGFRIEGKHRDAFFIEGRYIDAYMMARVRDAF